MIREAPLVALLLLSSSLGCQRGSSTLVRLTHEVEPNALQLVASTTPQPLADLLPCRAEVAVNGGFYDADGNPLGLVHTDGKAHSLLTTSGSGVALSRGGVVEIVHREHVGELDDVDWALQSIDRIVSGGKNLVGDREGPIDARSAIGVRADGTVVLISIYDEAAVIEETEGEVRLGKKSTSTGVSLWTLADLLIDEYDVVDALNLDGGYSTSFYTPQMYVVGFRPTINALVVCGQNH